MKKTESLSMSIRFVRALDELVGGKISEHYLKAGVGLTGTDQGDEGKYRRFSQLNVRDLLPMKYFKIQQMAFYQWQRYPLAKRIIDILVDFIVGEDLAIKVRIMKRSQDNDVDTMKGRSAGMG